MNNFQHAAIGPFYPIFSIKDAKVPLFFSHSTFSLVQKGSESRWQIYQQLFLSSKTVRSGLKIKKSEQFDKLMEYHA
jgi:hypothetical protein